MAMPAQGVILPDWPAPANVRACVTTRQLPGHSLPPFERCNLGGRSGDAPDTVAANRASLPGLLGLPSAPLWLRQVHGVDVLDADAGGRSRDADASVTRKPGTVLAVLTADCLPVLFCSADGDAIAAAHAGWRGLAAGVLEATLARLDVGRVHAWIGPAIGARSYEVGTEVRDAFVATDAGAVDADRAQRLLRPMQQVDDQRRGHQSVRDVEQLEREVEPRPVRCHRAVENRVLGT